MLPPTGRDTARPAPPPPAGDVQGALTRRHRQKVKHALPRRHRPEEVQGALTWHRRQERILDTRAACCAPAGRRSWLLFRAAADRRRSRAPCSATAGRRCRAPCHRRQEVKHALPCRRRVRQAATAPTDGLRSTYSQKGYGRHPGTCFFSSPVQGRAHRRSSV